MSFWSSLDPARLDSAESDLIAMSGVSVEPLRIPIDSSESYSVFCLKAGDPSKPPLILLHGYLGTSIIFFKLFKKLTKHYMLYCLDLMGFGRSSRPEFAASTREEAELFFTIPLEVCRVKLGLERFTLAGHSFGGYIAGCYAESFPQYVSKLVLISSIGVPKAPFSSPEEFLKGMNWKYRLMTKVFRYCAKNNLTPGVILRKLGPFTGRLVRNYMNNRWKNMPKAELDHLEGYLEQVNLYPGSGEFAFGRLFMEGGFAIKPLWERITDTPTVFIYGDRDWMDPEGATMNAEVNKAGVVCEIISHSGHHMYFDNPKELARKMVRVLKALGE
jgi:cardiolipin-specific phospholipase